MTKIITISRQEMELHRSNWRRVARQNKWIKGFKESNEAIQFFINRNGEITDSIYVMCGGKSKDVFANERGTRKVEVTIND